MASIKLHLDGRSSNRGNKQVRIRISHNHTNTIYPTGVYVPEEVFTGEEGNPISTQSRGYDSARIVLLDIIYRYNAGVHTLTRERKIDHMTAKEIRDFIFPDEKETTDRRKSFISYMEYYLTTLDNANTQRTFKYQIGVLREFCQYQGMKDLAFEELNYAFLEDAERWLIRTKRGESTRHQFFSYIRAALRNAIKREVYDGKNPFDRFSIKPVTKREVDCLKTEDLRSLLSLDLTNQQGVDTLTRARDLLMISFYLCGANVLDIFMLKKDCIEDNYICYVREKTKKNNMIRTRIYIEPELQELINKYAGDEYLFNFAESFATYSTFKRRANQRLGRLSFFTGTKVNFAKCRRTWATIAGELEINDKVINMSIGHKKNDVIEYYEKYSWERTKKANRAVISYVLEGVVPNSIFVPKIIRKGGN